jgi:hypothetical protein
MPKSWCAPGVCSCSFVPLSELVQARAAQSLDLRPHLGCLAAQSLAPLSCQCMVDELARRSAPRVSLTEAGIGVPHSASGDDYYLFEFRVRAAPSPATCPPRSLPPAVLTVTALALSTAGAAAASAASAAADADAADAADAADVAAADAAGLAATALRAAERLSPPAASIDRDRGSAGGGAFAVATSSCRQAAARAHAWARGMCEGACVPVGTVNRNTRIVYNI